MTGANAVWTALSGGAINSSNKWYCAIEKEREELPSELTRKTVLDQPPSPFQQSHVCHMQTIIAKQALPYMCTTLTVFPPELFPPAETLQTVSSTVHLIMSCSPYVSGTLGIIPGCVSYLK